MIQQALHKYWPQANRAIVAKMISEFAYEQAFQFQVSEDGFILNLDHGVSYWFKGKANIWGQVVIDPHTVTRTPDTGLLLATQFMMDIRSLLNIPDEALAEHFEDLNATLLGDCKLAVKKQAMTAKDLISLGCELQQTYFDGHPKFAFNKGRRGWGTDDLDLYAPESQRAFQLGWVAVHHSILQKSTNTRTDWQELVDSAVSEAEQAKLDRVFAQFEAKQQDYTLVPVHPWQWSQKLSLLFVREMADKSLLYLGEFGDYFLPQLSIRTLSNVSRPQGYDIKLPLTIMNTSCYRGIPGRYILAGPLASDWIDQVFKTDSLLLGKEAEVLQEPASAYAAQADYKQLEKAPYRYHELLGVIWRESLASKLRANESAILMAALMESDSLGNPLIGEYIAASGLSVEAWLTKLFDAVVIPFYHLLTKYGVSLIAHGQNITIVMENFAPKRILLKDFQGDMRLVERDLPEQDSLDPMVKAVTVRLPEELIIHDLQTGHFVTVLRFISPLTEKLGFTEQQFYRLLGDRIYDHIAWHPELEERYQRLDLFKPRILRIGLNLAKFRHSTDSSASRMLPDMDDMLDNPLVLAR
ncbi:IucA/IucC family protein [Photobacterium halotolerans]|uniref:IucA/IucC family siderophore biosynthesis protein n=1 Tax=Photobacterium halotolerans TaxID=265726 RepID=A0A7X4WBN3_9GAMM|nr:IucA/IucC family protein [Photobacterium halotolerans]NAW65811.1 IucA/IucC family siderophore biosynthesis protein [Photobacterium halotolerans]